MEWLVIDGVRPWDGRYEFDLGEQEPTTREWGFIKRFSGYLPLTIQQGLEGADPELFCVFAVIALRRAGRVEPGGEQELFDRFAEAPFGATIRLLSDSEPSGDVDASPPPQNSNGASSTPGDDSLTSSERSAPDQSRTGTPVSATSTSGPATSAR